MTYETSRFPSPDWRLVGIVAAVLVWIIVWLAAFRIEITDTELVFRALIGGTRRIHHSDISKISLRFDLSGWGGPLRLWVQPKSRTVAKFSINAKVFDRDAIRAVLDLGEQVATSNPDGRRNKR
jgi:hypothetical protein